MQASVIGISAHVLLSSTGEKLSESAPMLKFSGSVRCSFRHSRSRPARMLYNIDTALICCVRLTSTAAELSVVIVRLSIPTRHTGANMHHSSVSKHGAVNVSVDIFCLIPAWGKYDLRARSMWRPSSFTLFALPIVVTICEWYTPVTRGLSHRLT